MKALVLVLAACLGIVLAGVVASGLVWMLPPEARHPSVIWVAAAVVTVVTTGGIWIVYNRRAW